MMKRLLKISAFAEWIAFTVFVVVFGASVQPDYLIAAVALYAVAAGMLWFMVAALSKKRAPANRFPNCIPVGNPVIYALLGYFCYKAISDASGFDLAVPIAVGAAVGFGLLRWIISMIVLD